MSLENKREEINQIDEKIAKLLNERFHVSKEIGAIKRNLGLAIENPLREKEVLEKNQKFIDEEYQNAYQNIMNQIFIESRKVQS